MTRRIGELVAIPICFFLVLSGIVNSFASEKTTVIYVAKDGNDAWTGTLTAPSPDKLDGPLATLEGARNKIRTLKVYGELSSPVTIMVRGGMYVLDRTFLLEAQDSGSRECPILYRAYPGEIVVIRGTKRISARWEKYNDSIMKCTIPEAKNRAWDFNQLFVNGERKIRARIPNKGEYLRVGGEVEVESRKKTSFKYYSGDLRRWGNLNDAIIINYHSWDEAILRIMDLDEDKNIVSFTGPTRWDFNFGRDGLWGVQRYYVENVFEGLDSPGEWYLNRNTGELFYWPMEGENINDSDITAPVLCELLRLQGDLKNEHFVRYVTFSGFTFCESDWYLPPGGFGGKQAEIDSSVLSAIIFEGAERCAFKNNVVRNVGAHAVWFGDHCQYNSIEGNEITKAGAGAVKIGTVDGTNPSTKRNLVRNNHIHDCGEIYNGAVGIWIGQSAENTVSHNEIHDMNYTGISVGWTWSLADNTCYGNIIEFNEVYKVMKNANDGAGIYMLGKQPGTVIRNNIFHDISPEHHFGWGIYLDAEASNITVMNNIAYRCEHGGSMQHFGRNNLWTNNIFVNSDKQQLFIAAGRGSEENRWIQNIIYYSGENSYVMDGVNKGEEIFTAVKEMDYNLYFYTRGNRPEDLKFTRLPGIESLPDWQARGYDEHSIIADPLFVDIDNDDYTLRPDSPALKLGFKNIDVSKVGLIKED